jgi:uncharacterized iron-regulated membrane protein
MSTPASLIARRRSLFLRIHFWAALIASPFALVATLTGLLYVFTPQVESALHGHLDRVVPAGQPRALDTLVAAAQAAAPAGQHLKTVIVPGAADASVQVVFSPARHTGIAAAASHGEHAEHGGHGGAAKPAGHAGHAAHAGHGAGADQPVALVAVVANVTTTATAGDRLPRGTVVYVNPYTAQVLGSHAEMERFSMWSKRLHSTLLQGDGWRWMIELSASWMLVMLLTGIWLWWPRGQARALPEADARGRTGWKQWHGFLGVALAVVSLAILVTGLTWSKHAGSQIRSFRDAIGQAPPSPPKGLQSVPAAGQQALGWEGVLRAARQHASDVPLQMTPPRNAQGVWRIASTEQTDPLRKINLVLDAYSGRALFQADWEDQTAFGKGTAIGIPFHRGEFGWWNQAVLFAFGAGVLFSLVSGWAMFLLRRRQGSATLPRVLPGAWMAMPAAGWITGAILLVAMPLFALSAALVLVLEAALAWRQRTVRMVLAQG